MRKRGFRLSFLRTQSRSSMNKCMKKYYRRITACPSYGYDTVLLGKDSHCYVLVVTQARFPLFPTKVNAARMRNSTLIESCIMEILLTATRLAKLAETRRNS